ncbi:MAG: aminoacyl-tRNA hydrolase [Deltaproteobacteria bacterium]|nr:aminoacyl-tRNA hydrolase [Deltaproteobacteria bacterium]
MNRLSRLFESFRPSPSKPGSAGNANVEIRWIIAGLGNPGEQYRRSRHNLGFMTVQRLAQRYNCELTGRRFNGLYAQVGTEAGNAIMLMPQTFYNRSGDCAAAMLGYYKLSPERLIVVHDEMDLPEQQLRLKRGGGDAGNRGIRSIREALGTPDFIRVRFGIGHPCGCQGSIDYLLERLTDEELRTLEPKLQRAGDAVLAIMSDGLDRACSIYNQRV